MDYTAMDVMQGLGQAHANAHLIITSASNSTELWIKEGHIISVQGCHISQLFDRLTEPGSHIIVQPAHEGASNEANMRMNIGSFALHLAHEHDEKGGAPNGNGRPLPPALAGAPDSPATEAAALLQKKLSQRLLQRTRTPEEMAQILGAMNKVEIDKELCFPRDHPCSITIGRHEECDLVSFDGSVSRRHCRIHAIDNGFTVEDLKSANGTYLNGQRINVASATEHDVVLIGNERLILQFTD